MSHVLPNISRGRFFEPIFTSKKFDLYTSIYGILTCLGFLRVAQLEGGRKVPAAYNSKTINDNDMKLDGVVKDH